MWYERLLEHSESAELEIVTDSSFSVCIKFNSEDHVESARQWWIASFGFFSTTTPKMLTDSLDVEALIQFGWHLLDLSQNRTIGSRRAFVKASVVESIDLHQLAISVVLDGNDFRELKRTASTMQRYDDLGGTGFI